MKHIVLLLSWNVILQKLMFGTPYIKQVGGPFFFEEKTINSDIYLDMLEILAIPQIQSYAKVIFQQDEAIALTNISPTDVLSAVVSFCGLFDCQIEPGWIFSCGIVSNISSIKLLVLM